MSKLKIRNGNTWEEIPAGGVGVPSGGSIDDFLVKTGAEDYATGWRNFGATYFEVNNIDYTLNTAYFGNGFFSNTRLGITLLTFHTLTAAAALASGTQYKIADISDDVVDVVGETYVVGTGISGNSNVEFLWNTYGGNRALYLTPRANISSGATIRGQLLLIK